MNSPLFTSPIHGIIRLDLNQAPPQTSFPDSFPVWEHRVVGRAAHDPQISTKLHPGWELRIVGRACAWSQLPLTTLSRMMGNNSASSFQRYGLFQNFELFVPLLFYSENMTTKLTKHMAPNKEMTMKMHPRKSMPRAILWIMKKTYAYTWQWTLHPVADHEGNNMHLLLFPPRSIARSLQGGMFSGIRNVWVVLWASNLCPNIITTTITWYHHMKKDGESREFAKEEPFVLHACC